jgi:hypothetical protein
MCVTFDFYVFLVVTFECESLSLARKGTLLPKKNLGVCMELSLIHG